MGMSTCTYTHFPLRNTLLVISLGCFFFFSYPTRFKRLSVCNATRMRLLSVFVPVKSFLIWKKSGFFLNRFLFPVLLSRCLGLKPWAGGGGVGGGSQSATATLRFFNLVFSFCIVFRGLKYMEEGLEGG